MTLADAVRVRLEVEDLYTDYAACLDEGELERWPDFFVEHGVYRVVSRENYEQDLPLATMLCEGRGQTGVQAYDSVPGHHLAELSVDPLRLQGQAGQPLFRRQPLRAPRFPIGYFRHPFLIRSRLRLSHPGNQVLQDSTGVTLYSDRNRIVAADLPRLDVYLNNGGIGRNEAVVEEGC